MLPDLRVRVVLEASVSPSEDPEKVIRAMTNLTGGKGMVDPNTGRPRVVGDTLESLNEMREQFRDRRVRGAARRLLLYGVKGKTTSLMMNRQAAAAGVAALCGSPEESPLGPIYVTIQSKEVEKVIDWLTAYESG